MAKGIIKRKELSMWKYIKQYLHFAILAAVFMVGEVLMDLIQPGIMSQIVDDGVLGLNNGGIGNLKLIWKLGVCMVGLVLFGGLCGSLNNVFVHLSGQNIGNEIRKDCFCRLIVLCAFPFIVGCLAFCLSKANPLFSGLQAQLDSINAIMQEDVSGIRIIKDCVREVCEKVRFRKANDELIKTQLQVLVIFAFMNPVINALMYMVVAVILLVGSFEVGGGGATPGNIMAAVTYTTQLLNGILMLVMLFQNISRGIASWKRIKEVLHSEPELKDGTFCEKTKQQGEIEFREVSFSYPDSSQIVLDHINLTIHKGETVAIMGATGCGKTSLVSLIPRFYDVTDGAVLIDGIDVREYRQNTLREKIAVSLQKSELFSASIKENIAWGMPEASEEDIKAAAITAQADNFILSAPDGYNTVVAERGMSLSGGQKQRLSIARAVLKSAEILIFDDSTSALDLKTEADLYDALQKSNPQSTKIIIAQRIASVRRADRIVVMDNGRISARGSHEELMKSCMTYQDIYRSQIGEENEDNEQE